MPSFKDLHPFEERLNDSTKMRQRFPDRIPLILEKAARTNMPKTDKEKYLVPLELTVGQFVHIIARRLHLEPGQALFVFVGKTLPQTGASMIDMYNQYKDKDGYLYVTYSGEQTFG